MTKPTQQRTHAHEYDDECEEGTLTKVSPEHGGYYDVTSTTGWSCGVPAKYGVVPNVGDTFVTWGAIGRPIRGMSLNGRVLYYRTPAEQEIENAREIDKMKAERVGEYEGKRTEFDARVTALPDVLRQRVEAFREFGGDDWRYAFEPYELMCCEQAEKMARRFRHGDAIKAFAKMPPDEQRRALPELDEGHSGNSFSFSVRLAWLYVEHPEAVIKEHGAMCPLAGCDAYGCWARRAKVDEPA